MPIEQTEHKDTGDIQEETADETRVSIFTLADNDSLPITTDQAKEVFTVKMYDKHKKNENIFVTSRMFRQVGPSIVEAIVVYEAPRGNIPMNGKLYHWNLGVTSSVVFHTIKVEGYSEQKVIGDNSDIDNYDFGANIQVPELTLAVEMPTPFVANPQLWLDCVTRCNSEKIYVPGGWIEKYKAQYLGCDATHMQPGSAYFYKLTHYFRLKRLEIAFGKEDGSTLWLGADEVAWPTWKREPVDPDDPSLGTVRVPSVMDHGVIYKSTDLGTRLGVNFP
jgi:hypothetical protein